jgi:hypothetical protein
MPEAFFGTVKAGVLANVALVPAVEAAEFAN